MSRMPKEVHRSVLHHGLLNNWHCWGTLASVDIVARLWPGKVLRSSIRIPIAALHWFMIAKSARSVVRKQIVSALAILGLRSMAAAAASTYSRVVVPKFGGPEVFELQQDAPMPSPGTGEALIRVEAIGINPVETYIRAGTYAGLPETPFCPGHDCCGIVVALGAADSAPGLDDSSVSVGDRVITTSTRTGAYAEYVVAPTDRLISVPPSNSSDASDTKEKAVPSDAFVLSPSKAAAIGIPYSTAFRALF